MSFPFNPKWGLIIVTAQLWGPGGDTVARLALVTGASSTVISAAVLVTIGYDPALAPQRVAMTTGSGMEFVPRLSIDRIAALGQEQASFPLIRHTLPPSAAIDGLLGLDFLRDYELTVDFRGGRITLQ